MLEIKYFLYGFLFLYVVQIIDLLMQLLTSYMSVITIKHQSIINKYQKDLLEENENIERTPAIGFMATPHITQYDDNE